MNDSDRLSARQKGLIEKLIHSVRCFIDCVADYIYFGGEILIHAYIGTYAAWKRSSMPGLRSLGCAYKLNLISIRPEPKRSYQYGIDTVAYRFDNALPVQRSDLDSIPFANFFCINLKFTWNNPRLCGECSRSISGYGLKLLAQPDSCGTTQFGGSCFRLFFQPSGGDPVSNRFQQTFTFGSEFSDYPRKLALEGLLSLDLTLSKIKIQSCVLVCGRLTLFFQSCSQSILIIHQLLELLEIVACLSVRRIQQRIRLTDDLIRKFHPPGYLKPRGCAGYANNQAISRLQSHLVELN